MRDFKQNECTEYVHTNITNKKIKTFPLHEM